MASIFYHPTLRVIVSGIVAFILSSIVFYTAQQYSPLSPILTSEPGSKYTKVQPLLYIPPIGLGTWQIPKSKVRTARSEKANSSRDSLRNIPKDLIAD